jgi:acetyltransferase-like isoleucine patch superfamily enzyme
MANMNFVIAINSLFWKCYLRLRGARIGGKFKTRGWIDILLRDGAQWKNIEIGNNVSLGGKTYIRLRKNGKVILENGVRTGSEVWLVSANEQELRVGKNTVLGSYSIFNGGHGLRIGPNCVFAGFVYINTSDHNFKKEKLILEQGFFGDKVVIGGDVWLGGHCFVNKGVNIGTGTVVGAGSIVIKDLPKYKIVVGNPAKVLRDRE